MNTKDKAGSTAKENENIKSVPILNLRMMTDEEWNRLAYRNYLQRTGAVL